MVHSNAGLNLWLPLDSLQKNALQAKQQYSDDRSTKIDKIEIRESVGAIVFGFKGNFYVQVEGRTGKLVSVEKRYGGLIQDIHDGAILGDWTGLKSGFTKSIYSALLGGLLFFLTISGIYLWIKPILIKKNKMQNNHD